MIPKEHGGLELGATGACIAVEEFNRMPGLGQVFSGRYILNRKCFGIQTLTSNLVEGEIRRLRETKVIAFVA
jgi:hypothetical protein